MFIYRSYVLVNEIKSIEFAYASRQYVYLKRIANKVYSPKSFVAVKGIAILLVNILAILC